MSNSNSTTKPKFTVLKTVDTSSLRTLLSIIETDYVDLYTGDYKEIINILKEDYGVLVTEDQLFGVLQTEIQEEDNRLQYKHLNLK